MSNRAKRNGDLRRTATCPFCGEEHRRKSKEMRECRLRHRAGKGPLPDGPEPQTTESRPGSPATRYETDGLKGDKRAHGIERKARSGWTERKIAKHFGVPVEVVRETLAKAGHS